MQRLQDKYRKHVIPALRKDFGIANVMAVPRITKVTVNTGVGRNHKDDKMLERISRDLAQLTGQKPAVRNIKKSIASFKVREGSPVGYAATLRGTRMWDFLDRFISLALPLSKDFRGIDVKNVDQHGNLNIGIKGAQHFPGDQPGEHEGYLQLAGDGDHDSQGPRAGDRAVPWSGLPSQEITWQRPQQSLGAIRNPSFPRVPSSAVSSAVASMDTWQFQLCRICFRELAGQDCFRGVRKSSW